MPVIPRYDGAQTAPDVLPNARQQPLSPVNINPLGELAKGMGQVADVMQKAQDEADKVRVFEARNKLQNSVNDSLYGENGVFNRKGKNAIGALGQWEGDYDKTAQEIGKDLTPRQQQLYNQAAMEIRTGHRRQVLNYETDQLRAVADATYDASAQTSLSTISLNWNNPEILQREMAILDGAIIKKTQTAGVDAEVANLERAKWTSQAHAAVAASALNAGNTKYAKEYFTQNRENILPQERLRLEATINAESDKQQGISTAMALYQKYGAGDTLDVERMMNEARTELKDSPDALAVAEREIKSMVAERDISIKRVQDKALDEVMTSITNVRGRGRVPSIRDIPTKAFLALDPEKRFSIQNSLDALQERAERDAKERKNEADKAREKQLEDEASRQYWRLTLGGDLKNTNLGQYASTFLATDAGERKYADLLKTQQELRKGKTDLLTQIQGDSEMVNSYLKSAGLDKDEDAKVAAYTTFQTKLSAFEANKGGKATPEEKRRMAQDMFLKREIPTPWFSGGSDVNKPAYLMTPDEISRIKTINNVPKSEQDAIRADYRAVYGKDPSPAVIVDIYKQSIERAR